jgi:hypothetical protein
MKVFRLKRDPALGYLQSFVFGFFRFPAYFGELDDNGRYQSAHLARAAFCADFRRCSGVSLAAQA